MHFYMEVEVADVIICPAPRLLGITATRQKSPGTSRHMRQPHQVPHLHQPAMPPQRRVLGEISHNIVRRKELSPFE